MNPIEINITLTAGITDDLREILAAFAASSRQEAAEVNPAPALKAKEPEPAPAAASEPKPAPKAEDPKPEMPKELATLDPNGDYSAVDVRAAMDAARCRIEGADWKENTTGESYQKWHRKLTAYFKQVAARYGVEKPSALPDSQSRYHFIVDCAGIQISKDGSDLTEDLPF